MCACCVWCVCYERDVCVHKGVSLCVCIYVCVYRCREACATLEDIIRQEGCGPAYIRPTDGNVGEGRKQRAWRVMLV